MELKKTDIGLIPNDWEVRTIGDITINIIGGGTPSRSIKRYWNGNIPWVTVKDFSSFNKTSTQEYISESGLKNSSSRIVPKGEIIIATRIALGGIVIYDVDVSINQDLKHLSLDKTIDKNYFYYAYQNIASKIAEKGSGSTVLGLSLLDLKSFSIPIPLKTEQHRIAKTLIDTDTWIEKIRKLIEKKRQIRTGLLQKLFVPKSHWEIKRLEEIASLQRGFDLPNRHLKHGLYPVVYSNGINHYHNQYLVQGPGVVTGRSGTIGKVNYIKQNYWPHNTTLWVTNFHGNFPKFIYYLFLTLDIKNYATGSGVPTLNRNDLHDLEVSIPCIDEQIRIATILSDTDIELQAMERNLSKALSIKNGMMSRILKGEIRFRTH